MAPKAAEQKRSSGFIDLDDSSVKDLKLCIASFFAMVLIIFHYAWIMRQWVLNPDLPKSTLAIYSSTLVCTVVVVFGVIGKVIHPRIYGSKEDASVAEKKNE
ncbi:hypothetical protein OXX80_008126 [Metschnikowia pulcherrima]